MRGLFQIAVLLPIAFTVALPTGPGYKARQLDANTQLDHLDGQISRRSPVTTRKQAAANNAANTGNTGNTGTGSGSTPPPAGNNVPIPQRNSEVPQGDKQNNPLGLTGPGGQGGPRQMAGGVVGYDPNSKAPTAALDGRKDASGLDAAQMAGVNDKLGGPLTTTGHGTQADKDALAKNLSKQPSANQQGSANTVPLANAEAPPRVFGSNSNEPERTFGTIPLQNSNRSGGPERWVADQATPGQPGQVVAQNVPKDPNTQAFRDSTADSLRNPTGGPVVPGNLPTKPSKRSAKAFYA